MSGIKKGSKLIKIWLKCIFLKDIREHILIIFNIFTPNYIILLWCTTVFTIDRAFCPHGITLRIFYQRQILVWGKVHNQSEDLCKHRPLVNCLCTYLLQKYNKSVWKLECPYLLYYPKGWWGVFNVLVLTLT